MPVQRTRKTTNACSFACKLQFTQVVLAFNRPAVLITAGAGGLAFDFLACQIRHSVANGSPSMRRFFGAVLPRCRVVPLMVPGTCNTLRRENNEVFCMEGIDNWKHKLLLSSAWLIDRLLPECDRSFVTGSILCSSHWFGKLLTWRAQNHFKILLSWNFRSIFV